MSFQIYSSLRQSFVSQVSENNFKFWLKAYPSYYSSYEQTEQILVKGKNTASGRLLIQNKATQTKHVNYSVHSPETCHTIIITATNVHQIFVPRKLLLHESWSFDCKGCCF